MFSQRTSSQKPGDDLLANFRQQFPEVAVVTSEGAAPSISQTTSAVDNPAVQVHSQDERNPNEAFQDQDPTPRASHEPWRFTPSLLDPGSFAFGAYGNPGTGYYTPTPGGHNTLFHSQAGDLHTPTLGMGGIGTPLSMPNSNDALNSGAVVMDVSSFQSLQPHQFHHFNPFIQGPPAQQAFAPSSFVHQDTGYETMEQDGTPIDAAPPEHRVPSMPSMGVQQHKVGRMPMAHALPPNAEKFRFHSTLNAPTAMIRHADEIPITYLNKGQAYSLSVVDASANGPVTPGTRYRTFVRVSFEEDEQRKKPSVCWGLWKEGRGTNEAHQRGGKLQAVEYVEAGQPADADDKRTRVELESSSFDGFCVTWTPGVHGGADVNIAVRFNFLSTDFSHSKGVKGIPVRLCAKTSLIPPDGSLKDVEASPEVCFCKVKLFRDHGAERKLSNDVAHVKKSLDKLKHQLAQIESGMKDVGKRKRTSGASKLADSQRPGKVQKHKRTWSMSSASSAGGGGGRMTMEEDLQFKLQTLQDMFTSTRPVSILYLRGEDLDDPDLHPVSLPGDMSPPGKLDASAREGPNWRARSTKSSVTGSMISPSPSSLSLASQASGMWQSMEPAPSNKTLEQLSRVNRTDEAGTLSGWIEALGVDSSYRPPMEQVEKPVACFYIQHIDNSQQDKASYHRAVYLMKRSLEEFSFRIASKWGLEPSKIMRTIHVVQSGLEIEMDDDVIRELREGQDMRLEIEEVFEQPQPTKREWEMSLDAAGGDGEDDSPSSSGYILRLKF